MTMIKLPPDGNDRLDDTATIWAVRLDGIEDPTPGERITAFAICASEAAMLVVREGADRQRALDLLTACAEATGCFDVLDGEDGLQQLLDDKLRLHTGAAVPMNGAKLQPAGTEPVADAWATTGSLPAADADEDELGERDARPSAEPVSGHNGRDRWLRALATRRDLSALSLRLALLLSVHFNCRTGQCDPGYTKLADELGVSRRTLFRAVAELKAGGWVEVQRLGDEKVRFALFMPDRATGDSMVAPLQVTT